MSQDGSQKRAKRFKIAKKYVFEHTCFDLVFIIDLEHRASQEGPKRAQKPPKTPPESLQEAIQKGVQFWTHV